MFKLIAPIALVFLAVACEKASEPTPPPGAPSPATANAPTNPPAPPTPPAPATTGTAPSTGAVPAAGTENAGGGSPAAEADTIFAQRCSVCHGLDGKGDGVGAAALNPKPRNYTDAAWQASVTDDQIAKTIVEGGAAVGKSPLMAPNADLKDKPEVVKALVAKVRSFKGK